MKKLFYLLVAALAVTACQKDPDTDDLDNDYLVITNYDKAAAFNSFTTFYLPDSILLIDDKPEPEYWKDGNAQLIIDAFVRNMTARNYTRSENRETADLGIQLSYVQNTYYFLGYNDSPYWWWGYPGYWGPGYWGDWGYWYYPYPVYYSYSTGSLLADLINLEAPQGADQKLPVIWNAFMSGLLSGSAQIDVALTVRAVDQAFVQSPYLTK